MIKTRSTQGTIFGHGSIGWIFRPWRRSLKTFSTCSCWFGGVVAEDKISSFKFRGKVINQGQPGSTRVNCERRFKQFEHVWTRWGSGDHTAQCHKHPQTLKGRSSVTYDDLTCWAAAARHSKYYNSLARLAVIVRQVCNSLIAQAARDMATSPQRFWDWHAERDLLLGKAEKYGKVA